MTVTTLPTPLALGEVEYLLTPAEVAARHRTTVGVLANWRSAGSGPTYMKRGSRVFYRRSDLAAWEQTLLVAPVTPRAC